MTSRSSSPLRPLAVRVPDAMAMIGIGRSKLYQFIAAGEIETIKAGASTLVLTQSLEDFVARRRDPRGAPVAEN